MDGRQDARHPRRGVAIVHGLALFAAALAAIAAHGSRWDVAPLLVIATFTIVSDLTYVETGSAKLKVSGGALGLTLAAVLFGGGPAAAIGVASIAIGWLRAREDWHYFRNNLVTYAWCPLAAGLFFHAATNILHLGPHSAGYYLLVAPALFVEVGLNFVGIAGYQCYLDRTSLLTKAHETVIPYLSAELFSAVLTMSAAFVAVRTGTIGIALLGLTMVIFQYLVGELLKSKRRGDELHRIATTDDLTALANREQFRGRLEGRIADATDAGTRLSP